LNNRTKIFFTALFTTTAFPYLPFLFPWIPGQIFGFNLTGWAWMIMLLFTLITIIDLKYVEFPALTWAPWFLYILFSIIKNFSFLGLQLTLQYTLPLIIGIITSGIRYSADDLKWLFKWFMRLCISIYLLFIIGYFFRGGYGPSVAATIMLFSVAVSLLAGLYFITKEKKYLLFLILFFLVPVIEVTRMGIAATATVFILHFANNNLRTKIIFGILGGLILLTVFNSKSFQEKTFKRGEGKINELTFDYYENPNIKSSGRVSWRKALDPGLKAEPVWGNGPRADNEQLIKISKQRSGEAHNDYLAVRYNYGYVGLGLLVTGFVLTFISLYRISRKFKQNEIIWLLSTSALTLFFSFLMFMYTDNILKYTIYFPNYFFAIIGIVYSLKRDENFSGNAAL
jgi:hypothetical protein